MSNYVYNRVLCNKEVKTLIEENKLFIKYDYIYKKQKDNTYELKFNTKEIQNNNIIKIITDYEDTKWFLIEENFTEEHYYYKNNEIKLDIRKLNTNDENIIFDNTCFDTYYEFKYYSLSILINQKTT